MMSKVATEHCTVLSHERVYMQSPVEPFAFSLTTFKSASDGTNFI
jgi:hypothetical protein